MKTTITKNLLTFILLMCGMFSFSPADAQFCVCFCTPNGQPRNNAECYTKANGDPACRHSRCRFRIDNAATSNVSSLEDIYPNPVSTSTTVSFYVGQAGNVSLKIFDVSGRLITNLTDASFEEGDYEIIWDAAEVNAGVYFLRMETVGYTENLKLIVAK